MEGTIGEIRWFAGNFAPRNWAFCSGQIVAIRSNTALFAILGTMYGGDGSTTFGYPNFQGRVAIGAGQSATPNGLSTYTFGQNGGSATAALNLNNLPLHTHPASMSAGAVTSTATLNGVSGTTSSNNPAGALLQGDSAMSTFAPGTSATVAMAASSVTLTNIAGPTTLPTVTVQPAGAAGTPAHNNLQPYLGMNFIVCTAGVFPARN